jgi:hypothetical protein
VLIDFYVNIILTSQDVAFFANPHVIIPGHLPVSCLMKLYLLLRSMISRFKKKILDEINVYKELLKILSIKEGYFGNNAN